MSDQLAAYFYEHVVSPFEDYVKEKHSGVVGRSRDLKAALDAATALFHIREHLPGLPLSRPDVEKLCPDYRLVADVANAAKHRVIDRGKQPPLVTDINQVSEMVVTTIYRDSEGEYTGHEKCVLVTQNDGSTRDLLEALTNVTNFWWGYLHSKGVLPKAHTFRHSPRKHPLSREDAKHGQLGLSVRQGVRVDQALKLQRYDYDDNTVKPVDLTGCTFRGGIYEKPPLQLELTLKNPAGDEFNRTVTLTKEEAEKLEHLSDDGELANLYMQRLPSVQQAMQELAKEAALPDAHKGNSSKTPERTNQLLQVDKA